jgi:hypothetical protein
MSNNIRKGFKKHLQLVLIPKPFTNIYSCIQMFKYRINAFCLFIFVLLSPGTRVLKQKMKGYVRNEKQSAIDW